MTDASPVKRIKSSRMASTQMSPSAPVQFYRRMLPELCVDFGSSEGKAIFKQALASGHMECYFKLAAQFRTQEEPAYCGLSTLVMVLNALSVDPGQVWKGPWRWYHENMLECCVPLEMIKAKGITLNEFVCLASCNGLDVKVTQVNGSASYEEFRALVQATTQIDDKILVSSYSRRILQQTGDGHFSPIGGYDPNTDRVLMLDVARFKYPPHWVELKVMWEAMQAIDSETGRPRGYCLLQRTADVEPLILLRASPELCKSERGVKDGFDEFLDRWNTWLNAETEIDSSKKEDQISVLIVSAIQEMLEGLKSLSESEHFLTTQMDFKCPMILNSQHACVIQDIITELKKTPLYKTVQNVLDTNTVYQSLAHRLWAQSCLEEQELNNDECECFPSLSEKLDDGIFVTALVYSWPYNPEKHTYSSTRRGLLHCRLKQEVILLPQVVRNEMKQLSKQLDNVLKVYRSVGCSTASQCCRK